MLVDKFNVEKFGDVLPHMENILRCGLYSYSFVTFETSWSRGMFQIIGIAPESIEPDFDHFIGYVLPEDKEKVKLTIKTAREKKEAYTVDFSILDAKGIYKRIHA